MVRFDDTIATVLAAAPADGRGRAVAWRQLVDLLAQGRSSARQADAYALLRTAREDVPPTERGAIAATFADCPLPVELVRFFAEDRLSIAAPLLGRVSLPVDEWLPLIPQLSPGARSVLRNRRDLDPAVVRALASFGRADLVVGGPEGEEAEFESEEGPAAPPVAPRAAEPERQAPIAPEPVLGAPPPPGGGTQIRDLLDRIESFRERRGAGRADADAAPPAEGFAFETDAEGRIVWVEGVPRAPLIGQTIAAPGGEHGVDGQAAGAFRRRAPFRNARLSVAGQGPAGGFWRMSAVPFFDEARGRFEGYRGTARRPRRDEVAGDETAPLFGSGLAPDALRQLVHELRTPLNAIQGFADMIDGQMLGPAATGYRGRAADIAQQARRLLGAVDDLDVAARVQGERAADVVGTADGAQILARLHHEQEPLAREGEVALAVVISSPTPLLAVNAAAAERMMSRLLAATIGLAARGETLRVTYGADPVAAAMVRLAVSRPEALSGLAEAQLLDPGFTPGGDFPSAPALGLGFALRLVSNLARQAGGRLAIEEESFALLMPAAGEAAVAERGQG